MTALAEQSRNTLDPIRDAYRAHALAYLTQCETLVRSMRLLLEQEPVDVTGMLALGDAYHRNQELAGAALTGYGAALSSAGLA